MKRHAWTIGMAMVFAGLGCHKDMPAGGTITLGSIIATTGPDSAIGAEELLALRLAIDEINAAGGLLGAYGTGLAEAFQSNFTTLGGTVTDNLQYAESQRSYVDLYTTAYMKNPEAILIVAYDDDGAQLVKDYNANFSAKNTFFYFTD